MKKHFVERFDIQQFEGSLVKQGYLRIAGVDEAGRGALAGPVVAAAVILPFRCEITGLTDSKQLTSAQREAFFSQIERDAVRVGIGIVDHQIIDQINILQATKLAMQKAIESIIPPPDYVLVDGNQLPLVQMPGQSVIKGDSLVQSIAAASVMAKVTRDRIMIAFDVDYPDFGFKKHKGYGTPRHRQAIVDLDPCPIHRTSFKLT
ncbi:TPA: ribonuclease HII [Candidatus Poribacteria bacterium]|nr:ribonuclease HII [Candidatus Poribacteria bacterium]